MNEASAINLCIKHRDPIGFEFLVLRYQREAYSHAAFLLGNRDDEAGRLGANAIVGLRFTTSFVSQAAAELLAFGTAVVIEDE